MSSQEPEDPEVEKVGQKQDGHEDQSRRDRIVVLVVFMLICALSLVWDEHVVPNSDNWRERHREGDDPYDDGDDEVGETWCSASVSLGVDDRDVAVDGDRKERQSGAENEEGGGEGEELASRLAVPAREKHAVLNQEDFYYNSVCRFVCVCACTSVH